MMAVFVLYLFLIFTVLILVVTEKTSYKTYFSPFPLLSIPYVGIITYQIIVTNIYKWKPISPIYLTYVLLFLVGFYMTGNVFVYFLHFLTKRYNKTNLVALSDNISYNTSFIMGDYRRIKVLELLSIVSAIYLILDFAMNMRILPRIGMIVQDEFQSMYQSGINFYLRLICMVGAVYFWGLTNQNNKKFFLAGFLCFIPNFFTFVKGIAFIIILGGILANYILNKKRLKFKLLVRVLIIGIVIFFLVYMVEIGIWDINKLLTKDTYEFIYAKLNVYLSSGVQSFNINISNENTVFQDVPNPVYAPIVNAFHKFAIAERIDTINKIWVNIGYIPHYGNVYVNTNTYIGTLVLYCGLIEGMLVNSLIALFIYYFFWRAIKTNSTLHVIRYSLMVTGVVLGWFDYYYMQTFWIYLIILFGLINLIHCSTFTKNRAHLSKFY